MQELNDPGATGKHGPGWRRPVRGQETDKGPDADGLVSTQL
jgi:hypothetical protein